MSVGFASPDIDVRSVVAAAALPALVGATSLAEGYTLPQSTTALAGAVVGGVVLAAVGGLAWRWRERGLLVAPGVAVGGAVAVLGWAVLAPGVSVARVGGGAVVAGDPVLSRFVGASPLFALAVCGVALGEGVVSGADTGLKLPRPREADVGRRRALAWALPVGAGLAVLSVAPSVLLGDALAPSLAGFALGGGFVGGAVLAYLLGRHGLLTPLLAFTAVAAASTAAVTAGGSPRGFALAWPVWAVPGLLLGGVEAVARRVWDRLRGE